ncbi:MAG: signal peptidase I [Mycobacteriales bacterium]
MREASGSTSGPDAPSGSPGAATAPRGVTRHRAGERFDPDASVPAGDAETDTWRPRATIRRGHRRDRRRRVLEWPILILVAIVVAVILRTFVVQSFWIPSGSMNNTLLRGDRVLVDKLSYDLHGIHRGDVVVFRRPANVQIEDDDLIKRVIGLPGDILSARGGVMYDHSTPLKQPYVLPSCQGTRDFKPVTVPAGDVFVMGDNRCNSYDSRFFGPISQSLIVGHAFVRLWPPSRWGGL